MRASGNIVTIWGSCIEWLISRALRERKRPASRFSPSPWQRQQRKAPFFTGRAPKAQVVIYLRYMNSAVRTQYTSDEVCRPLPAFFLYGRRTHPAMYLPLKFMSPQAFYKPNCGAPFHAAACALFPSPIYPVKCAKISLFSAARTHVKWATFRPSKWCFFFSATAIVFQELFIWITRPCRGRVTKSRES